MPLLKPFWVSPLTAKEAAECARIHQEIENDPWSAPLFSSLLQQQATYGLGAYSENSLIGFIIAHYIEPTLEILTFAVARPWQRQGVGSKLLTDLSNLSHCTEVVLEVSVQNQQALSFYNKAGFIPLGRRKSYYQTGQDRVDGLILRFLRN